MGETRTTRNRLGWLAVLLRFYAVAAALLMTTQAAVAFFGFPPAFYRWMTGMDETLREAPRYIVCLGGAGIPSESGLARTYYAAEYGVRFTNASVIVSLPCEGDPMTNSVGRMRGELIMRGVAADAILMEHKAWNTHRQAVEIAALLGRGALEEPVLLVTSPYHCRRSVLCFRKAGFLRVGCVPSEDVYAEADPGEQTAIRYGFWSALDLQLKFIRELTAMAYYKLRGWI